MKTFWELREDVDAAVKAFLKKGGKIKKLAPGKAAGYHGKDDPGKDMRGMMDRGDTKAFGTRKKVKSMESTMQDVDHRDPDFRSLLKKHGVKHTVMSKGPNKGFNTVKLHGSPDAIKKVKSTMQREEIGVKVLRKGKEVKPTPKIGVKKIVKGKEVTEISKATKGSYVRKAADDMAKAADKMARQTRKDDPKVMGRAAARFIKRRTGIARATK